MKKKIIIQGASEGAEEARFHCVKAVVDEPKKKR